MGMNIDQFTKAYIEAALWSSTDGNDDPLDDNYSTDNLSPELLSQIIVDCQSFQTNHSGAWANAQTRREWSADQQAGHDFWLTRNGHGAGFWDKPEIYGQENADKLTEICKRLPEINLYVGDDGTIHAM